MHPPRPRGPKHLFLLRSGGPRLPLLLVGVLALAAGGCEEDPQVRVYDAPVDRVPTAAAAPAAEPAPGADADATLAWTVPPGYRDTGESNQFRTATLVSEGEPAVEVAISRVPGQAGSIAANVNRWRGQLGLPPASKQEVIDAVEPAPTGADGLSGMVVTLANPQASPPAAQRVAWFERPDATWYVKATGTPDAVERETPALDAFLASLRPPGTPGSPELATP